MIVCESILVTTLLAILIASIYSDCRISKIHNRTLAYGATIATLTDFAYYSLWARGFLVVFISNVVILSVMSVLLYIYHLWAAGDSKLLMVISLCLPGRFLSFWDIGLFSSFVIIMISFSSALVFVVTESLVLAFKGEKSFTPPRTDVDFAYYTISFLFMVSTTSIVAAFANLILPDTLLAFKILPLAIDSIVILSIMQIRNHLDRRTLTITTGAAWVALIMLKISGVIFQTQFINLYQWMLVLLVIVVIKLARKYSYQEIPTSEVRAGQILSATTVASFAPSRVKGLPTDMTEDLRSRLSVEEADSVRRWGHSTFGKPSVVIVRKMPFAVFIAIGTLTLLAVEVVMQW